MNIETNLQSARKGITAIIMMASIATVCAKDKKGVIMTIDGEDVPTEEFLYLFQKNNEQQTQPQSLDEYLNLFEVYRLKVAEAKKTGVDTTQNFLKEMAQYRRELLEPYLADSTFLNNLVDIAADREKTQVESSHIMIIRTHGEKKDAQNLALLDSIRLELLNGADFITLAKNYSQDKFSSDKGGYLGFSPAGTYPYGFETAVYETPEGEISEIIESHVGWHIVKSGARKPTEEFNRQPRARDIVKADVMKRIQSPFDSRYHQIRKKISENLKQKHPELNSKLKGLSDEAAYEMLINAEEKTQYESNPAYRNLVNEYTNGSLLYEVSVENVWNKASNDEEGLQNYYEANKNSYKWESPHAKGVLIQALNDSVANEIKEKLVNVPSDSIVTFVRKNFRREATADRFNVAQGVNPMIDNVMFGAPVTTPKAHNFTTYFVVEGRVVENPETLNDVKSVVVADYQDILEKDWVANLRKNHVIEINEKELGRLKNTLK